MTAEFDNRLQTMGEDLRQRATMNGQPDEPPGPLADLLDQVHRRSLRERITKPLPPMKWEWHGLLAEHQLAYLHGMGGLSKSLLAQAFAGRSRGGFLLDRPVRSARTLYLDAENDDTIIDDRLRRLGVGADDTLIYHRVEPGILAASGRRLDALLEHLITEAEATRTILDSAGSLWGDDELDQVKVQAFFNSLNRVRLSAGSAILLLGHDNRRGDYRGLALIHNLVQSRIHIRPTNPADEKEDGGPVTDLTLRHHKQRGAAPVPKMPFRVTWTPQRVSFASTLAHSGMLETIVRKIHTAGGSTVPTSALQAEFGLPKNWLGEHADMLHMCGCERDREDDPRQSRGWRPR